MLHLQEPPQACDHGRGAMIRVILPYQETAAVDADKKKSKEMSHGV